MSVGSPPRARSEALQTVWPAANVVGDQVAFPCVLMRGGTSRGAYLRQEDLPLEQGLRDRVVLALYGSPDARQIDGLGGAHPLTSKLAIVSRCADSCADVDYLFAQVRVDEAVVDYTGNCGNILAGVGPFAVDAGLVPAVEPMTLVRIRNVNTGSVVGAEVPVASGRASVCGETVIAGVPRSGAAIGLDFSGAAGTLGRGLLPTKRARESLPLRDGTRPTVSIVDAGNATVFVDARALGLAADELVSDEFPEEAAALLSAIRAAAAVRLGLASDEKGADAETPAVPKVYAVLPPAGYTARDGRRMARAAVSLVGRGLVMGRPHPAYATTVAVCTAAATRIPGTVVADCAGVAFGERGCRIGHPSGVLSIDVEVSGSESGQDGDGPTLRRAVLERTARRIMEGLAYVPLDVI